ncbi:MAG: hypothetical protein Q8Q67_01610 [bacterium]|nr:hypothetical protein [bacterium]
MRKKLISLVVALTSSVIAMFIMVIYLVGVYLFPGTLNELSLIFGITVMISIAWMKFSHLLDQLQLEKLHYKVRHVNGLFILMAIYSMILIFIARHAEMKTVPVYMWIIILTTLVLYDTAILTKKNLWAGRISHGVTIMFMVSIAMYYQTQYVWLISIAYSTVVIFISAMGVFRWKNMDLYLGGYSLVIALVLTIVQFWPHLRPIYLWLSDNYVLVIIILCIALIFFYIRRVHIKAKQKKIEHQQIAQRQKLMREKEARIATEKVREEQANIVKKILAKEQITFAEFNKLTKDSLNQTKGEWLSLITQLNLTEIVEISELKKKLVWDQSVLTKALQQLDLIFASTQNDLLLQLLIDDVNALKKCAEREYTGSGTLLNHVRRDCHFANCYF